MNLVWIYTTTGIENIPYEQLSEILSNRHGSLKVKSVSKGLIILNDNRIIKCAIEYFIRPDSVGNKKIKAANQCYYDQKSLGITGVTNYDCANCIRRCIQMKLSGELVRRI